MANIRVKDLPNTDTLVDSDELIVDSSSAGTRRVSYGEVKTEIAADYVAAPSTYKVATLAADNKLDPSQIPDTISGGYNFVGVANNVGDLVSTTQGDFYVIQTAFGAYSVGDRAVYDGSAYVRVTDGTVLIAEGGTGAITAADARTNLSVNSINEDAEAAGTKLVGPALYFDGSNDYLEVADDAKFSFTDGTDDLPFSISAWVKMEDATNFKPLGKMGTTLFEWLFGTNSSDQFGLAVYTPTHQCNIFTNAALSSYEGSWVHLAATFSGAGPNSSNAFTTAGNAMSLYINGVDVTADSTVANSASYTGMSNTSQAVWVGRFTNTYSKGHIKEVKLYNRSLTTTEVAQLARGTDLGFSEEWGGSLGGVYTSNFTGDANSFTAINGTVNHSTSVGGESNALRLTVDTAATAHYLQKTSVFTQGKRYRIKGRFYIPTNSHVDGIYIAAGTSGAVQVIRESAPTLDAWNDFDVEIVASATADPDRLIVYALDGNSTTVTDPGGNDVLYIKDFVITEIGTLADFRAENFDSDTGKLYDLSDNGFVGTSANLPTLTGRAYPVYETGTWTPSLYFSGTSAATYSAQSGYYTRIGNTVYVRGSISVSSVGASSGSVSVAGLPFQPSSDGASSSIAGCHMTSAANLTSQPIGLVYDGVSLIELYDAGATGNTALDETNITASSVIKVSATYHIQ